MKLVVTALTLVLSHLVSSQNVSLPHRSASVVPGNGNDFIDKLLEVTKLAYSEELDPHPLPDLGFSFEKQALFLTYKGKAQLHDGMLSGLMSLHRDDDCTMQYNAEGFYVDVPLGMGVLHFDYKGTLSFMDIGPSIELHGTVAFVSIQMEIEVKAGSEPVLKEFKLIEMVGVDIQIRKRPLINLFVNVISKIVVKLFNAQIKNIVEKEVRGMLAEKIKTLKLPM